MPSFVSDKHNINTRQSENKNYHIKTDDFLPLAAKSFHVNCIKLWNEVPPPIKHQTSNNNNKILSIIITQWNIYIKINPVA